MKRVVKKCTRCIQRIYIALTTFHDHKVMTQFYIAGFVLGYVSKAVSTYNLLYWQYYIGVILIIFRKAHSNFRASLILYGVASKLVKVIKTFSLL